MTAKRLLQLSIAPSKHSAAAAALRRPQLVHARDDAAGAEKQENGAPRILIVEDDFLVASEVQVTLEDAGLDVTGIATSAEEAIKLAAHERPDLVLMDIRLAGRQDGVEAALRLFRDHGIRCIFATAHADEHARRRAAPAEPLGWLQKPYTMTSLVALVRRVLHGGRQ